MNATFWEIFKRCDWVCFISISFWSRQFLVGIEGNLNLGVCDKIGLFLQCISLMSSRNSEEEEGEKWPPGDIGIIRALAAEPTHMGDLSCPKKGMSTTFYGTRTLIIVWVIPDSDLTLNFLAPKSYSIFGSSPFQSTVHITMFENFSKCRIWMVQFWHFSSIFCSIRNWAIW